MTAFEDATQIGLHSARNLIGSTKQLSLFSDSSDLPKGLNKNTLQGKIERFGIDLTDMQSRVMEGILRGFSSTDYKGNAKATEKSELQQELGEELPDNYKYVQRLPKLRASQKDILEWSGINTNSIATYARALDALKSLGEKQYCFFYDRISTDECGVPEVDSKGRVKTEEVSAIGSIFTIKEVRNKRSGFLKYYEIIPNPVFLDQRESYFMLVPHDWRNEVQALYGRKKASSYTFRFLFFLRYQYEIKRRRENPDDNFIIEWDPEEIAAAIKMPEYVITKHKKRMNQTLDDVYSIGQRLNYLSRYERKDYVDILHLNKDKYFDSRDLDFNWPFKAFIAE